ncbi:hypothetical protein MRB53_010078 [Persea americana]|uniref:Uncharacterized protein n=1 Tax=Persea americana TaxID=3435 RepID=A0ACC2LS03_PERAE|nr:hypothetical protein MRB53_010078 [Persea americana]
MQSKPQNIETSLSIKKISQSEMESKLLIAAILISSWVSGAFSEGVSDPSCVTSLLPCQPYLKGDVKPSPQCCLNLKDAVNKDLPCLCNVLSNEAILKEFNVTKQEAMAFPSKCGIKTPDCSSTNGTTPSPSAPVAPAVDPGSGSALDGCGLIGVLFLCLMSLFISSFQG